MPPSTFLLMTPSQLFPIDHPNPMDGEIITDVNVRESPQGKLLLEFFHSLRKLYFSSEWWEVTECIKQTLISRDTYEQFICDQETTAAFLAILSRFCAPTFFEEELCFLWEEGRLSRYVVRCLEENWNLFTDHGIKKIKCLDTSKRVLSVFQQEHKSLY
jgi:hypothetical protein